MTTTEPQPRSNRTEPVRSLPKLGEELPVFCEKCGYALHGLTQTRCEHCTLLQFHCPECGHHQPINTLRPAAQTLLGRIRGGWLAIVIFFKLNLFGWLLFAWCGMGNGWSYRYVTTSYTAGQYHLRLAQAEITRDAVLAFGLFGLLSGIIWRMALLRWKRDWAVGIVMAMLIVPAIMLGVVIKQMGHTDTYPSAYNTDFLLLIALGCAAIILGAIIVWPVWTLIVHAFLPAKTARSLLNWQRSLSNQVSALARPE